jgi:hypothetical protein
MHTGPLSNVDNDVDVGVVVVVGSTGHFDVLVGHADVVGVDLKIFRSGHHDKLDRALRTERLVRPLAHRANLFDGSDTWRGEVGLGQQGLSGGDGCSDLVAD